MGMAMRARIGAMGLAAGLAVLLATPAAAQRMSEGHQFLESVRERDGTVTTVRSFGYDDFRDSLS